MTKSELIKNLHRETDLNLNQIEDIVNKLFAQMINGLSVDGKVVISGFGTFEKYYQEGYIGVNPSNGKKIKVPGNYKIRFNASKKIKANM